MGELEQRANNDGDEMESSSKSADAASASTLGKEEDDQEECPNRPLTQREILNLTFALLAWACTICNVTLSTYRTVPNRTVTAASIASTITSMFALSHSPTFLPRTFVFVLLLT
jgi:hypothetical protein